MAHRSAHTMYREKKNCYDYKEGVGNESVKINQEEVEEKKEAGTELERENVEGRNMIGRGMLRGTRRTLTGKGDREMLTPSWSRDEKEEEEKKKKSCKISFDPNFSWDNLEIKQSSKAKKVLAGTIPKQVIAVEKKTSSAPQYPSYEAIQFKPLSLLESLGVRLSLSSLSTEPMERAKKGFLNTKNSCFMNSCLQCLLACPPFFNFLSDILSQLGEEKEKQIMKESGILCRCLELEKYFHVDYQNKGGRYTISPVPAEEVFEEIYQAFNPYHEQQDCQEFLAFLLDSLHLELDSPEADPNPKKEEKKVDDDDEWVEVGKKNKKLVVRNEEWSNVRDTMIMRIFGGIHKNECKISGRSLVSATYQPFFMLHLDIPSSPPFSLEHSLRLFFKAQEIEDYKDPYTGEKVRATHQEIIDQLPEIMIIHLKRFVFSPQTQRIEKISDFVSFPRKLEIPRELLSTRLERLKAENTYHLFALVIHHGWNVEKGHYVSCTEEAGGRWKFYDDKSIRGIKREDVEKSKAYLLFYQRISSESQK